MAQLMEVLEFLDDTGECMVKRIPEVGPTEIKWGAQLTVRESQEVVFFRDGKSLDLFGPGRHILQTQNIPKITKWVTSFGYGQDSPFRAEVYFVGKQLFSNLKWGTFEPFLFKDSELKFYSESGEILNAKFSKRLLLSIFNKKSPLHDGAVIIHGEKIIAARCILPVSENENLPMNFGMRHRAAYAISEDTDALAIVISEEHNTLSLFLNGNIKKNLTSVKLRSHIVEYLDGDYNKKLN